MQLDFTGRRVLVTGSARGIGKAIALAFAQAGAQVILHGVSDSPKLRATKTEMDNLGYGTETAIGNLGDRQQTTQMISQLLTLGSIDILVLNASVQYRKPWLEIEPEEMEEQLQVNLFSSLFLCQQCIPVMAQQGFGRVITIGSVQQHRPHPDMAIYAASKAAQVNLVQNLAKQVSGQNLTINNVAPGVILTDRNIEALKDPDYGQTVKNAIPVGYFGEPQDCAGIVLLLASEQGRYITGQDIVVDGGLGLH